MGERERDGKIEERGERGRGQASEARRKRGKIQPGPPSGLEPEAPVADDSDDVARAGIEHEADGECPICFEPLAESTSNAESIPATLATTPCGHLFHTKCLASAMLADMKHTRQPSCPMCRGLLHDFKLGDAEGSNEAIRNHVAARGSGAYDPAFDTSAFPLCYIAPSPGAHGMRNLRSNLLCTRGKQPAPRLFACTQELPGGQVSPTGDPMHEWRAGTIRSYNRSMGAYKVRFSEEEEDEWRALDISLYGTHGEYKDGKPAGGHWVLLELSSLG